MSDQPTGTNSDQFSCIVPRLAAHHCTRPSAPFPANYPPRPRLRDLRATKSEAANSACAPRVCRERIIATDSDKNANGSIRIRFFLFFLPGPPPGAKVSDEKQKAPTARTQKQCLSPETRDMFRAWGCGANYGLPGAIVIVRRGRAQRSPKLTGPSGGKAPEKVVSKRPRWPREGGRCQGQVVRGEETASGGLTL